MEKRGMLNVKNSRSYFEILPYRLLKSKRSQAWGIDISVALVIFTLGILLFFFYAVNRPNAATDNINSMSSEGEAIADSVLSQGHPDNWNTTHVATIGIISDNKVNETKLKYLYNLSVEDYSRTKALFNTRFEYYISFSENMSIEELEVEGIGNKPDNEKDLMRITRFTIYKNKPTTAYFDVWEANTLS